MKKFDRHS